MIPCFLLKNKVFWKQQYNIHPYNFLANDPNLMYDISKFKLAFPLCKEQKVISKFHILAEKFHFKQLNFFKAHPVLFCLSKLMNKKPKQLNKDMFFLAGRVLMNSKTKKSQKLRLWIAKPLCCLNILPHGVKKSIESKQ